MNTYRYSLAKQDVLFGYVAEATRSVLMTLLKINDISNERVIDSNDVMM